MSGLSQLRSSRQWQTTNEIEGEGGFVMCFCEVDMRLRAGSRGQDEGRIRVLGVD